MNKSELIAAISNKSTGRYDAGITKVVVEAVLDTMSDVVHGELQGGGEITLHGIGKLSVKDRPARVGRNPSTGEDIKIPAKRVPKFSAAKALKDAVAAPAKKGKK
ncbi:MAG: HU family DNA-binding protein [Pseudomonadota bacterium]